VGCLGRPPFISAWLAMRLSAVCGLAARKIGCSLFDLSVSFMAFHSAYVVGALRLYFASMSSFVQTRWPTYDRVSCQTLPFQVMNRLTLFSSKFLSAAMLLMSMNWLSGWRLIMSWGASRWGGARR